MSDYSVEFEALRQMSHWHELSIEAVERTEAQLPRNVDGGHATQLLDVILGNYLLRVAGHKYTAHGIKTSLDTTIHAYEAAETNAVDAIANLASEFE